MQFVLELGSIDKPLTFDVGLIQLSFIPVCSPNTCKGVFNPNVTIFLPRVWHFSAFHYVFLYAYSVCGCVAVCVHV